MLHSAPLAVGSDDGRVFRHTLATISWGNKTKASTCLPLPCDQSQLSIISPTHKVKPCAGRRSAHGRAFPWGSGGLGGATSCVSSCVSWHQQLGCTNEGYPRVRLIHATILSYRIFAWVKELRTLRRENGKQWQGAPMGMRKLWDGLGGISRQ